MAGVLPAGFKQLPLPLVQLSLAAVLKCGQSFRWSILPIHESATAQTPLRDAHEYRLCLHDRVVCLRQTEHALLYRSVLPVQSSPGEQIVKDLETVAWLRDYFQLDVDLVELYDQWSMHDPVFAKLRSRFEGIRMLRQDPWENLVSFICSSNNNISRITKMVQALCKHYSPPLLSIPTPSPAVGAELEEHTYHPFPPPSVLARPEVSGILRSLGFGYRADFIQRTAKMLVDEHGVSKSRASHVREASEQWLLTLRQASTSEAREALLKFMGVGRKVADCVLLMSLDKKEVIPVDTHVHQIAVKHYGLRSPAGKQTMNPKLYDEVNVKLEKVWGNYAGWAHSVLFTADLKSFSSYGLPAPTVPITPQKRPTQQPHPEDALPTPPPTPTPSATPTRKRARPSYTEAVDTTRRVHTAATLSADDRVVKVAAVVSEGLLQVPVDEGSLAERVKRRRRRVL